MNVCCVYDFKADYEAEPSPRALSKRDSTGASSMDADSIASGGDSASLSPKKISELINNLRIRSLSQDESSAGLSGAGVGTGLDGAGAVDEWVNDDDTGYTIITLSEEEFFDYEEVNRT